MCINMSNIASSYVIHMSPTQSVTMQLPHYDISPNAQATQDVPTSNTHRSECLDFASPCDSGALENHVPAIQEPPMVRAEAEPSTIAPINMPSEIFPDLCSTFPTQQSVGYKPRTRRIFGIVKGNNSSGRRGKLSCTECRKIKSRCKYESQDQACERCGERNLECLKTWGPKQAVRELIRVEELVNTSVGFSLLVAPASGLEIDQQMLYYFRKSYQVMNLEALWGVYFQHLWSKYGPMFSNDCHILQRAIAISLLPNGYISAVSWITSRERVLFHEWLSRFHNSLGRDFKALNVNESHLFAMFWVISAHRFTVTWDVNTRQLYGIGFATIMRHLYRLFTSGTGSRPSYCSTLWPWMLSEIRYLEYYSSRTRLTQLEDRIIDFWWELHSLYEAIGPVDDRLREHPSLQYHRFYYQCFDILMSLKTCLIVFLRPRRVSENLAHQRSVEIKLSVQNLRQQTEKIRASQEASELLRIMHSLPLSKIAMHNLWSGRTEFLSIILLQMLLILHLLENVIFESTSPDCIGIARFTCQFAQTSPYLTSCLKFLQVIFLAGGLLPRMQYLEEKIWIIKQLRFYSPSSGDALEKLWNSNMESSDYADFLLEFYSLPSIEGTRQSIPETYPGN